MKISKKYSLCKGCKYFKTWSGDYDRLYPERYVSCQHPGHKDNKLKYNEMVKNCHDYEQKILLKFLKNPMFKFILYMFLLILGAEILYYLPQIIDKFLLN